MTGPRRFQTALFLFAALCCLAAITPSASRAVPLSVPGSIPAEPGQADLQLLLNDIGKQRDLVVAIQRELVKRPAMIPREGGEGEEAKARWIESWLKEKGLPHAERLDSPDARVPSKIRPSLVIRYPGKVSRTLWIVAHLDVSLPGHLDLWTGSPWALRVEGDTIYGRGVEDNHQAIVSGLVLLESLHRQRVTPDLSLGLLFMSAGKEPFSPHGFQNVRALRPDLITPDDLVIVNDFGNADGTLIETAEKGLLWLEITVIGKQAASGTPYKGVNALEAAAALIMDLRGLAGQFPASDPIFDPAPTSTFACTTGEGDKGAINLLSGKFTFTMDCRLLPAYTVDEVEAAVRRLADKAGARDKVRIEVKRISAVQGAPSTPPDALVVTSLARAVKARLNRQVVLGGIGGVTQATEMRAAGLPVAVWAATESRGFFANESITVTGLLDATKTFARILFDPEAARAVKPQPDPIHNERTEEKNP